MVVIHHTEPRYTKHVDLWVEPNTANASRALDALRAFGAPLLGLEQRDLCDPELACPIGIGPNRIDLLTGLEALAFEPAWVHGVETTYRGVPIRVPGLGDLVRTKKASGRPQDLLDAARLEQVRKQRSRAPQWSASNSI
jgi:hypothetical protein